MTKKLFIKYLANFAIWLIKASITVSLLTGVIAVVAIFGTRGTLALLDEYGPFALIGELLILTFGLMLACGETQQSRQKMLKAEREAAFEESEPPEKPESRWRRNAPATLTDVPLEEWAIGALTILRQIELTFDSEQFYGDVACGPILHAVDPDQHMTCIFVDEANPVALHAFTRNGGVAFQQEVITGDPGKPTSVPLPFYLVIFPTAKTNDTLADLARSIKSEAQAEIDRRAVKNKKENHRD